jgi:ATP-dependent DNA helicase UvrD/PcrA
MSELNVGGHHITNDTKAKTPEMDRHAKAKAERGAQVHKILGSPALKKVVVAGPGTGKTFLFKMVLSDKKNSLTLTFVNSLVEDLSLELNGLSNVRTLHSFARALLSELTKREVRIAPKLPEVIKEDAAILVKADVDFNKLFHERDDKNVHIAFYEKRKTYYGKYYGYSDVIFSAVRHLEVNKNEIPVYEQIVVDEFQDFNQLEVSLIDLLAERSPVLIVGDDDQALYDFKSASPDHIRNRHADRKLGYEAFNLPFCSRSTRVIVEATNDIIDTGKKKGFLKGRIAKPYIYFDDPAKDRVSADNPMISYSQVFATQIPWFITKDIGAIARELKGPFSVLIISPTKVQSRDLAISLKKKGFERVEYADRAGKKEPTLLDGLRILLTNDKDNLGWRIVAGCLLEEKVFATLLQQSDDQNAKNFHEMVDRECKAKVKDMLTVLRKLANDKPIDNESVETLKILGLDPYKILRDMLAEEMELEEQEFGNRATRKISIKMTTIESSKGLAADYVFITHFDDTYFIKDKKKTPTDKEICNFLVSLTRARMKVFLISSKKVDPAFLSWIGKDKIERIAIREN